MIYQRLVREAYKEAIALDQEIPSDLRVALKAHERMPLLFQNLALEIERVQAMRVKEGKQPYSEQTLKSMVYDFVKIFTSGVKLEAERRAQSDIERYRAEAEAKKKQDLESTLSGTPSGEFKEILDQVAVDTSRSV